MFPFIASNVSISFRAKYLAKLVFSDIMRFMTRITGYDSECTLPDVSDLETIFVQRNSTCPTETFRAMISEK